MWHAVERSMNVDQNSNMGTAANGVDCGVVEWVKRGTLRLFGRVVKNE